MLRKLNRAFQDYMRPKRLALGKWRWDRKDQFIINSEELMAKENLVEELDIKSILFLRYDGKIGDMIINTLMFREIKKQYPEVKIGVVTRGAAKDIIANNPYVDKIYDYDKSTSKIKVLGGRIAEEGYDLLIDFSEMLRVNQMMFINLCKAKINMGVNKPNWNLFDLNLKYHITDKHITNRYQRVLELLGIEDIDLSYDIHLTEAQEETGRRLRREVGEEKLIVINPYGASKYRTFNRSRIEEIVKGILEAENTAVTFVYPPDKTSEVEEICSSFDERVYFVGKLESVMDTASILKHSDLVITPDTSIVHMGVAFDKEMIAVYRSDEGTGENNSLVWGPGSPRVKQIFSEGKSRAGEELDINNFNSKDILNLI